MRDDHPVDHDAAEGGFSGFSRLRSGFSTAIGATVALALIVVTGVWFHRLGARDAEDVPIIRASVEPTKTRPEDPGGVVTPYQEITSYEVASDGGRTADANVVTAPPPPEPLREDVAMGMLVPAPAERPETATSSRQGVAQPTSPSGAPGAPPPSAADEDAPSERYDPEQMGTSAAVTGPETEAEEITALVRQATLEAAVTPKPAETVSVGRGKDPMPGASDYAPPRSPVAPQRPADLLSRMQAALRSAEQATDDRARRAAESAIQIQLAADPDEQIVRAMWRRISRANSDILHGRELAVQSTVSGGTTYYRLRVGPFAGMSEAQAVCQALKARGQDCIVARNG